MFAGRSVKALAAAKKTKKFPCSFGFTCCAPQCWANAHSQALVAGMLCCAVLWECAVSWKETPNTLGSNCCDAKNALFVLATISCGACAIRCSEIPQTKRKQSAVSETRGGWGASWQAKNHNKPNTSQQRCCFYARQTANYVTARRAERPKLSHICCGSGF